MIESIFKPAASRDDLHPNMFMQNLLGYGGIKGGRYSYYTSKALGYTALEDVAESAARI